ncbi:MAG: class GN sortase [Hyphomicrobiales bacterium]|nr:class GN sortase [Hyphomicrobiales bacterium]
MVLNISKRKNSTRYLAITIVALLGIAGIALIGSGLWIKAKANLAQILLNQAFEETVFSTLKSGIKPWYWADMKPFARLKVPRLEVSSIVLNDISGEALAFGPGHMVNTPVPGENGTSVFAAHRDTHFSWLKNLQLGDVLSVERTDGNKVSFKVIRSWIARYDESGINADSSSKRLILSTCYPFDSNTPGPLRYLVEAEIDHTTAISSLEYLNR